MCSFFTALRLNIRTRIWTLPVVIIFMCFALNGYPYLYYRSYTAQTLPKFFSPDMMAGILCGVVSVFIAAQGYGYLHSPHKVDMFHSLPITMKNRFFVIYTAGIVIFFAGFAVNVAGGFLWSRMAGIGEEPFYLAMLLKAGLLILWFLCIYHMCIYAFTLTGNILIGLLVTLLMAVYVDLWQKVFNQSLHLDAYAAFFAHEAYDISVVDLFFHNVTRIKDSVPGGRELIHILKGAGGLLIWILLLFRWAKKSYIIRPAESSKSLVILYSSRMLIKLMIVVPISLLMGEAVYENFYARPYVAQGIAMVITAYVVSFFTESIFSKSVKVAFHSVGSVIFSLFVIFIFFGIFRVWEAKYNAYVPEEDDIESFAVYNPLDSYYYSYNMEFTRDGSVRWFYDPAKFVEDNMILYDTEAVLNLVGKSMRDDVNKMRSPIPMQVYYRLKDHTNRARLIWIDMDNPSNRIYLNRIMGPAYYKAGIWQAFSKDIPQNASVYSTEYHDLVGGKYISLGEGKNGADEIVKKWRTAMVMYDYDHVRYHEVIGEILVYFDDGFYRWVLPVYEDMYPVVFDEAADDASDAASE